MLASGKLNNDLSCIYEYVYIYAAYSAQTLLYSVLSDLFYLIFAVDFQVIFSFWQTNYKKTYALLT